MADQSDRPTDDPRSDGAGPDARSHDARRFAEAAGEFSPDGVIVVDRDGTIHFANASMHQLARAAAPLVGTNVDDLVPARHHDHHAALRDGYAVDPEPRPLGVGLDLALRRADGTECPVEIALSPFDDSGLRVVATVRDVSERRRIAAELAEADRRIALLDERSRIGRDLHDVVLQRLYAAGLMVQAIGTGAPPDTGEQLDRVIDEIDRIITEVRTIVFTLGRSARGGALGEELADVVAQASRLLGFTPALRIDGPVDSVLGDEARVELISSLREALGNVARHARASMVDVTLEVRGDQVVLRVTDDGVGPPAERSDVAEGNGLVNLAARAAVLGGTCELRAADGAGAVLEWSVPY